ncbi:MULTISPECIES: hypothetical protein [Psychrobacter]|nr:hypothetical protein [Psychrobacter immobilis]
MSKLKNNAIASVQGITYQNLVALEKCLELTEDQTLYIEIWGDVTIEDDSQVEVKHEKGSLNNLSQSFWKTVSNWLDNDKFKSYSELILLTTQKLNENSLFKGFNEKCVESKIKVLEKIQNDYSTQTVKSDTTLGYLTTVMSASKRDNLRIVLEKFSLITEAPSYTEIHERLCQTHASFLSDGKDKSYIKVLTGYVHNQIAQSNGEIKYEEFTEEKRRISQQLISKVLSFPATYVSYQPSEEEEAKALELPFVKKIYDIEYDDEISIEAIEHFYRQRKTVSEEMQGYENRDYRSYEDNLRNQHKAEYRLSSLDTKIETQIKDSKRFYLKFLATPASPFQNYNDTPVFFRNGYLHELINENDDMIWKLKVDDQ